MDPQSNQDYDLNPPNPANNMATMPLPMPAAAPTQQPVGPMGGGQVLADAPVATPAPAQAYPQSPPIPAQAPPLLAVPGAALAPVPVNLNPTANPVVTASTGASMAATPDIAADNDVIEAAWVVQAKESSIRDS